MAVPNWAWHQRLAALQEMPVLPQLSKDVGEAVEVESLSSKTTSESCGQPDLAPLTMLPSWEPTPDALQPNRSVPMRFMRPRLNDEERCKMSSGPVIDFLE
ncbi:unnamed protein product [Effrenium voratum]|nr:unnamed protein product [Effrenium voratum]